LASTKKNAIESDGVLYYSKHNLNRWFPPANREYKP
jgi:hypothetical protein